MSALARLLCQRFFGLLILGLINMRRSPGKSHSNRVQRHPAVSDL